MKKTAHDIIYALVLLGISAFFFMETQSETFQISGPGLSGDVYFYPQILLFLLAALSLALIVQSLLSRARRAEPLAVEKFAPFLLTMALTIAFAVLFPIVPFLVLGISYCGLLGFFLGYRNYPYLLGMSLCFPVAVSLVFENLLDVPLP
tara:strand:- start:2869 stop:3315 length:447 start_codon:yes stop_codon:yes gene_type:complete